MKLFRAIKLHRKLRIRQEVLCHKVVMWSQRENPLRFEECPSSTEFSSVNNAVRRIEKKLPGLYFFLSDIFGGSSYIRNKSNKIKVGQEKS